MSGGFALILATYSLFGLPAAAWVAGMSTLFGQGIANRGNPLRATLFNSGQYVLAVAAAGYAYIWLNNIGLISLYAWLPLMIFALGFLLVNHVLIYFYLLPRRRQYPGQTWQDAIKWDGLTYLVSVPLGLLIAMLYPHLGLTGLLLLFFPVLVLQMIMRHYIHLNVVNTELKVFYDVAAYLSNNPKTAELLEYILMRVRNVFSFHAGVAYLHSGKKHVFTPAASSGHYAKHLNKEEIHYGQGVIGEALESGHPVIIEDCRTSHRTMNEEGWCRLMRSLLIIPLRANEEDLGVIVLGERNPSVFDDKHVHIMSVLGQHTVLTVEKEIAKAQREHASHLDTLTGMLHPTAFLQALVEMCTGEEDERIPVGLVLMNVDRMQRVNSMYGRDAGEQVLKELSMIIKGYTTSGDLVARYGGTEFVIALPGVTGQRLMDVAGSIRERVMEHYFLTSQNNQARVTISAGVAELPQDAEDATGLLQAATRALDKAQKDGHNRVVSVAFMNIKMRIN
jgi:diguanylate cyclase (GGDEF)-like protein